MSRWSATIVDALLTIEPDPATVLQAGDNLFVFTTVERLMPLIEYGLKQSNPAAKLLRDLFWYAAWGIPDIGLSPICWIWGAG